MHLAYLLSSFLNCRPVSSRSPSIYNQHPKADKSAPTVIRVMLLKVTIRSLQFDLDVHACGQIQTCKGFNRFIRRIDDIDQALVSSYFKLLTRIFIDKW